MKYKKTPNLGQSLSKSSILLLQAILLLYNKVSCFLSVTNIPGFLNMRPCVKHTHRPNELTQQDYSDQIVKQIYLCYDLIFHFIQLPTSQDFFFFWSMIQTKKQGFTFSPQETNLNNNNPSLDFSDLLDSLNQFKSSLTLNKQTSRIIMLFRILCCKTLLGTILHSAA